MPGDASSEYLKEKQIMSSCHSNKPHKEHGEHASHEVHKGNQNMESQASSNAMAGQAEIYTCPMSAANDSGAIYTCPMHPQIRQNGPGNCPICGMSLEPEVVTGEAGPNPELADMTRRFWIGVFLTLPVFLLEMGAHVFNLHIVAPQISNWLQLGFASPVVLWSGWPFIERGWKSVQNRSLNMFTLIAMGTGVAWIYSVIATAIPGIFPQAFRGSHGAVSVYFEAAAVITVLVLLGQVLELKAREQTSGAIKALLKLAPATARRIIETGEEEISLSHVHADDLLRVRPGDKVPVDGVVVEGKSSIDESMVTGESMPAKKEMGSPVIGGTINQTGSFIMKAQKVGQETMLARIVKMVAEAQRNRAPIQRLADTVSGVFVPAVILIALIAFAVWFIYGPDPAFTYGLIAAVSVLIIACPKRLFVHLSVRLLLYLSASRNYWPRLV